MSEAEHTAIYSRNLVLRPMAVSDAMGLLPTLSHPDVMRWTPRGPLSSVAQAQDWVRDHIKAGSAFNFTVYLEEDGGADGKGTSECIGVMGSHKAPQIGYLIHPNYAGRGYATEALKALLPPLFKWLAHVPVHDQSETGGQGAEETRLVYDYVEAMVLSDNIPSWRVLEKCGFSLWEEIHREQGDILNVYRLARPGSSLGDPPSQKSAG